MDAERDVLQHLAMAGIAETDEVVEATTHDTDTVRETLATLEREGAVEDEGFWYLTDAGEERLARLCRERFGDDQLAELRSLYAEFESLDGRMKACAEAWQDLDAAARGPSAAPVGDLAAINDAVQDLFGELDRETRAAYESYIARLDEAVERLMDGEDAYFTGTDVDSYHTVWFELHDDLLRTLGEERS